MFLGTLGMLILVIGLIIFIIFHQRKIIRYQLQLQRLELESRDIRRRIEHAHSREDKRVLNKQLEELKQQIDVLRSRLP